LTPYRVNSIFRVFELAVGEKRRNCGQFLTDIKIIISLQNETAIDLVVVRKIKTQQDEALFMRAFLCLLEMYGE
jgi:hypothetical protein